MMFFPGVKSKKQKKRTTIHRLSRKLIDLTILKTNKGVIGHVIGSSVYKRKSQVIGRENSRKRQDFCKRAIH